MEAKDIFAHAQADAFAYADAALARNVFPTDAALENMQHFEEDLLEAGTDAEAVLQMLNDYGSPATVSQIGGRYFGFVNGGVVPAGLAPRWLSDFWDQNSALALMSPITSRLEEVCEHWVKQLLGLGLDNIESVAADEQGCIIPSRIPPLDDRTLLILQAGNVLRCRRFPSGHRWRLRFGQRR